MVRIEGGRLRGYCASIRQGLGVPNDQAETVALSLVEADLRGTASHGVNLVSLYVSRIREGSMKPRTEVRVLADDGTTLQLDGGLGPGQVAGVVAIDEAIERALQHGVGAVSVKEGAHLSTNPFSYAISAGEEASIVFDIATTAVAGNKLILARKRGEPIPEDWAADENGVPTTDPHRASLDGLQWFGGHKGFGIAFLVEILAGVLTDRSYGRTERSESAFESKARVATGYLFLTLDVARFLLLPAFGDQMDRLIREVRNAERAEGVERIYVAGEIEREKRLENPEAGVPIAEAVITELEAHGREFGLSALAQS